MVGAMLYVAQSLKVAAGSAELVPAASQDMCFAYVLHQNENN